MSDVSHLFGYLSLCVHATPLLEVDFTESIGDMFTDVTTNGAFVKEKVEGENNA